MASESGDHFAGGSPPAFSPVDSDNDEDLVGTQLTTDILDLDMLDSQQEPTKHLLTKYNGSKDFGRGAGTGALFENRVAKMLGSEKIDRISALLTDSAEYDSTKCPRYDRGAHDQKSDPNDKEANIMVKDEFPIIEGIPRGFLAGEVIDLSDTEEDVVVVKQEHDKSPFNWTSMSDDTISISDDDEKGPYVVLDGGTEVSIKTENSDVEFLWSDMGNGVIDLDSDEDHTQTRQPRLGKSLLGRANPRFKHPPVSIARMKEMQRLYAARALGNRVPAALGSTQRAHQSLGTQSSGYTSGVDNFAWMSDTTIPDDRPRTEFLAMQEIYRAKRKSRKNTSLDDVLYKKAVSEENQRLKRLAQEACDSESSDEAEESDDGLFMPHVTTKSSAKTPLSFMDDDDDDDDDNVFVPTQKPAVKSSKTDVPTPELSTKRSRAKDLEKELRKNMLAGIEAVLLRDRKQIEDQTTKKAEAEAAQSGLKKSSKRKKKQQKSYDSAKRTKTGRMNNVGSLMNSNIYEDSNANLDKQSLPLVTEKKKKDFMTSLIANIPLEDQKQANQDRIDIVKASKILALRKVVPDGKGNWAFKGMKSSLYHYQVQGAAYMKQRETGDQEPHGGILADEMGLGKTVQMIATMVANPQADPAKPKCTLIVCSPALIQQWEKELDKHADPRIFPRIVRHHSTSKFSGKGAEGLMAETDIILTTYGEVVNSYPSCKFPKELQTPAEKEAWWQKEWEDHRGLLHKTQFYRIVLDEAQVIKNHMSQTSIACRALMAKHRWAISGTPIQNRLDELFPYFKFLRVKHTGSISVFRQNFCLKDSDVCNKRLHSMLAGMMVRRTHSDTVLGAPLIKLPKNTQETIKLKFNKVERHIYELVRMRCVKTINCIAKDGTLEQQTKAIIIMFQRLRQMTSHIFMVQEVLEKQLEVCNVEDMWKHIISQREDYTSTEENMLVALKKMIEGKEVVSDDSPNGGMLFANPKDQAEVPKSKKKTDNLVSRFGKFLKDLKKQSKWTELRERSLCHKCGDPPEEPYVTSCLHLYCKDCLTDLAYNAAQQDQDETPCAKCGEFFTESQQCGDLKELQIRDLSASIFQGSKEKTDEKKPFKLTMKYVDSKDGLLLSTKVAAVKVQLEKWTKEDPDGRIIVFTEWLMVMHVLGRVCQNQGWKCCHYNGKMSHKARDESLSSFRDENSDVKILIASLKCGGTGLNLTVASRVFCVDLWFNSCVEQQAFARVFRIGQTQETYITRCVVEGTVDERLIEMQEEKKGIISTAMDDRSVMAQLTLPELLRLFGPVAYDENSKPFIFVDDEEELRSQKPPPSTRD